MRYLLDFDKNFPNVKTIMMMENYRSTPEILSVANSLIDKNKERIKKDLIPRLPSGQRTVCFHGANSEQESDWIADQILQLHDTGVPYPDGGGGTTEGEGALHHLQRCAVLRPG